MSENTNVVVGGAASEAVVAGLMETLATKQAVVKSKKDALANAEWEQGKKAKNAQYVLGSLRKASPAEVEALGVHCHGWCCEIECLTCGTIRIVNTQDAHQVRYCKACKPEGKKAAAKAKRAAKAQSPEAIKAKIAALEAEMAALVAKEDKAIGDLEVEVTDEQLAALRAQIAA
jgi:hypothetical protein